MKSDGNRGLTIRPFLKWVGGKRWLLKKRPLILPNVFNCYFEPFVGSGAVYFFLNPSRAVLADINRNVIETFVAVKLDPLGVEELLERHADLHCADYYYSMRSCVPRSIVGRAARMIYLNRTCFNGVYRLNRAGVFNVPKGARDDVVFEDDDFIRASEVLERTELCCSDFEMVIDDSRRFDFVFADPPYTILHNVNGFVKYNERLFSWNDQIRLANCLERALHRGVKILCTNADHASVRELYATRGFLLERITRFSGIAADARKRNAFGELLIKSPNLYNERVVSPN